jgi:3-deoxy-7-phosphoheptulonate synthase
MVAGITIGAGSPVWMVRPLQRSSPPDQVKRASPRGWLPRRAPSSAAAPSSRAPRRTLLRATADEALGWMRRGRRRHGLRVVTEAMSEADVSAVAEHADLVQVGSRNMQNFALLKAVGATGKPVLLKRGMARLVEEWLLAGEYLLKAGSPLCHLLRARHSRLRPTHPQPARPRRRRPPRARPSAQPVVVDPSHATGRRDLILPLAPRGPRRGRRGPHDRDPRRPRTRRRADGPQALPLDQLAATLLRSLGATGRAASRRREGRWRAMTRARIGGFYKLLGAEGAARALLAATPRCSRDARGAGAPGRRRPRRRRSPTSMSENVIARTACPFSASRSTSW